MSVPSPLDISSEFSLLTAEQQELVVAYMRRLQAGVKPTYPSKPPFKKKPLPEGTPGSELVKFAGCISKEDLDLMEKAIEEGCEQIDHAGWGKADGW